MFAAVYGPSISSISLRHAVLAIAAFSRSRRSSGTSALMEKQVSRVYQQLSKQKHSSLNEGDLLAVYLLGMLSALRSKPDEFLCHLRGFASIMKILGKSYASAELSIFWPMARLQFLRYGSGLSDDNLLWFWQESQRVVGSPNTTQTGKYCKFWATEMGTPDKGLSWALIDTLFQSYTILRRCLRTTANRQSNECLGLDINTASILSDLKDVLYSDIQVQVTMFENLVKEEIRNGSDRDCNIDAYEITLMYRIICFLVTLLEAPTVFGALGPSFKSALEIVSLLKYFYPRYYDATHEWLHPQILSISWVAGLAFSWEEFPESKCL